MCNYILITIINLSNTLLCGISPALISFVEDAGFSVVGLKRLLKSITMQGLLNYA